VVIVLILTLSRHIQITPIPLISFGWNMTPKCISCYLKLTSVEEVRHLLHHITVNKTSPDPTRKIMQTIMAHTINMVTSDCL